MDKFVKGENEMWKMPAKERIQTRIVSASALKRVLDFHKIGQLPTASGVLLMVSGIIYLFQ